MNRLTLYILSQCLAPFVITAIALTGLVWLVRALRMLDLVIVNGQSFWIYAQLLALTLPAVLVVTLPAAVFIALLYTLYRLVSDNEITVMFASGAGPFRVARPVLIFASLILGLVLFLDFYALPRGSQMLQLKLFQIRADIASSILRPGIFVNPARGVTLFVTAYDTEGAIHGIFFQDQRDPDTPITYMAQTGALLRTQQGARLVMFNGNIQRRDRRAENDGLTFLSFDKYSYDLSPLIGGKITASLRRKDMYLTDLLQPEPNVSEKEQGLRILTAHERLSAPLYCLAYALLALTLLAPGAFGRHSLGPRIALIAAAAAATRLSGLAAGYIAQRRPETAFLLYAVPIAAGLAGILFIAPFPKTPLTTQAR